jgi:hypothetical protein
MSKLAWFVTLAIELLLLACSAPQGQNELPEAQLVGSWKSDTFMTQLGSASETLCLRPDHTVSIVTTTQAGDVATTGTYSYDGHVLTLRSAYGPASRAIVAKINLRELVLTPDSGDQRHYRRIKNTC